METADYRSITLYGVHDRITEEGALEIEAAMQYFDNFKSDFILAKLFKQTNSNSAHHYIVSARKHYEKYRSSIKKVYRLFGKQNISWRINWYKAHGETPCASYLLNLPVSKEDTEECVNI